MTDTNTITLTRAQYEALLAEKETLEGQVGGSGLPAALPAVSDATSPFLDAVFPMNIGPVKGFGDLYTAFRACSGEVVNGGLERDERHAGHVAFL